MKQKHWRIWFARRLPPGCGGMSHTQGTWVTAKDEEEAKRKGERVAKRHGAVLTDVFEEDEDFQEDEE